MFSPAIEITAEAGGGRYHGDTTEFVLCVTTFNISRRGTVIAMTTTSVGY